MQHPGVFLEMVSLGDVRLLILLQKFQNYQWRGSRNRSNEVLKLALQWLHLHFLIRPRHSKRNTQFGQNKKHHFKPFFAKNTYAKVPYQRKNSAFQKFFFSEEKNIQNFSFWLESSKRKKLFSRSHGKNDERIYEIIQIKCFQLNARHKKIGRQHKKVEPLVTLRSAPDQIRKYCKVA